MPKIDYLGGVLLVLSLSTLLLALNQGSKEGWNSFYGGKLADRMGSRVPAAIGMAILSLALYSFSFMDEKISVGAIAWRLILMGIGLAFTMSPLSNGVMGTLPKDKIGVGSGVFNLFKNVGGSVGVAIMGTLLNNRQIVHGSILAEYINSGSEAVVRSLSMLQASFTNAGVPAGQAQIAAFSTLQGLVAKQASVSAFQDVFLTTAVICAGGVILALFIKDARVPVQLDDSKLNANITNGEGLEAASAL